MYFKMIFNKDLFFIHFFESLNHRILLCHYLYFIMNLIRVHNKIFQALQMNLHNGYVLYHIIDSLFIDWNTYACILHINSKKPPIFLHRFYKDINTNLMGNFVRKIHPTNKKVQFLVDPYALATYCIVIWIFLIKQLLNRFNYNDNKMRSWHQILAWRNQMVRIEKGYASKWWVVYWQS